MKKLYVIITFVTSMLHVTSVCSQVTFGGNSFPGGTNFIGWDNSASVTLDIKNNSVGPTKPIDFYIDNNKFLQVLTGGDLNTVVGTNGYMINNNYVLRNNGIIRNIYLGVGAGNVNNTHSNTFVGYNTGLNNGNSALLLRHGSRNTFVGHQAGMTNDMGEENTFVGDSCGYNTLSKGSDG